MIALNLKTQPQMETIVVERKGLDLIIIGGGPAGLTAGIYACRIGLNTLLIEKALLGGMATMAEKIENYPGFPGGISGIDLTKHFETQARNFGLQTYFGSAISIEMKDNLKSVTVDGIKFSSRSLIIATGTESKKLGIPGEEKFRGRGVSYCALCDGPFYKGKKVVVVGGGNAAVEEALFLSSFASLVTVVHRRDALRADKILELKAKDNPKIYFSWDTVIEEIKGADKVEGIAVSNVKTKKKSIIECNGIFVYIGAIPNSSFIKDNVKLNKDGFIITDANMKTSAPGIFAAGDVREKSLRQVITACADGATAAASARAYLEEM